MRANGRTIDSPSSIQPYISQRRSYLLGLITTNVPANFAITLNGGGDFSTNRNLVTLTGTASIDVRSVTINGVVYPLTWTSVSNWTAQVALSGGVNALAAQGLHAPRNPDNRGGGQQNVDYTGAVRIAGDELGTNETTD